jgi:SAM-dependent methyltransferase
MRDITEALLGVRMTRGGDLLDVGCGTGGFLRWAAGRDSFKRIAGVDISAEAIAFARLRVPTAELQVAPILDLPFETASFDLIVLNDVLQHVPDTDIERALQELRRVLRADGAVLLRTNGARRARSEGDWRVYDRRALRSALERAGFHCCRLTYANVVGTLWATVRRHTPTAPSRDRHGIPPIGSRPANAVMYQLLRAEATYLRRSRLGLPFGHTLFALATSGEIEWTAGFREAPSQMPGQQ